MKYYVRTYGCQMNVADSGEMARHLNDLGFTATDDPDEASVYLMNTCTVRQHAEDRAFSEIGRLRRWKAARPDRKVIVTGCAAERTREYLEDRFPHIDLVAGAKSIENFGRIVAGVLDRPAVEEAFDYAVPVDGRYSAFVTIMRGCNYSCTYCIVPYVRGRESYRPMADVLDDVRARVEEGARDITLLGQTVNSYHRDGGRGGNSDFADLLEAVGAVDGVERVRFISPHPYFMTDRVIEAMARVPAVCESLHLPVQSGSNAILRAMRRNYSRAQYLELVGKLRAAMPDITISTDVIVGFPGETEADFAETLSLIENVQFDWGFIFKYSPRSGTPAADRTPHPDALVEERHQDCLALMESIGRRRRARLVGGRHEVLVEENGAGRTRGNYRVQISGTAAPGRLLSVTITNADRATLEGVV